MSLLKDANGTAGVTYASIFTGKAEKANLPINVRDYWNAAHADDTISVAAAIAALPATDGALEFPARVHTVTGTNRFENLTNVRIIGNGATLKLKDGQAGAATTLRLLEFSGCNGVTIEGLRINGNRAGQGATYSEQNHGIAFCTFVGATTCTNVTIRDCTITNCAGDCILVGAYADVQGLLVTGCDLSDPNTGGGANARQGIALQWCSAVRIIGNDFTGSNAIAGRMAIDIEPGVSGQIVSNVIIKGNTMSAGWNRSIAVISSTGTTARRISFIDNDCAKYAYANRLGSGVMQDIKFDNNRIDQGVYMVGVDTASACGNVCHNRDHDALTTSIVYLSDCTTYKVNNNHATTLVAGAATVGIQVAGVSHHGTICGNVIFMHGSAGTATGIKVTGSGVGCVIEGNYGAGVSSSMLAGIDFTSHTGSRIFVGTNDFTYNVTSPIVGAELTAVYQATLTGSTTWDPASLGIGASERKSVTVTGARAGHSATAGLSTIAATGWDITAAVIANDTVEVKITNNTAGVVDLASGTVRAVVTKTP